LHAAAAVLALRQLRVEADAARRAAEAQAQNTEQQHMSGRLASAGSRPTYNKCPTLIMNNSQHLQTNQYKPVNTTTQVDGALNEQASTRAQAAQS
jgi:hypothetical protein